MFRLLFHMICSLSARVRSAEPGSPADVPDIVARNGVLDVSWRVCF
jgi:hypothetical protein